jgi:DNA-binding protein YbaB
MTSRQIWHERAEHQLAAALQQSAQAQEVAARVAELRGTARTPDGAVQVDVDHRGFVLDVRLTERAKELGTDGLAQAVLTTTREAIADVQRQAAPLQATLAGPRVDLTDTTMLDDLDAALRGRVPGGER